jgi:hypothetical protein
MKYESSYKGALAAAGAQVLAFEEFGSWQGDWLAFVEYKGEKGWVQGSYGTCSGCDAFYAEFGCDDPTQEALADFGRTYLDGLLTRERMLEYAERTRVYGDDEAKQMIAFVKGYSK